MATFSWAVSVTCKNPTFRIGLIPCNPTRKMQSQITGSEFLVSPEKRLRIYKLSFVISAFGYVITILTRRFYKDFPCPWLKIFKPTTHLVKTFIESLVYAPQSLLNNTEGHSLQDRFSVIRFKERFLVHCDYTLSSIIENIYLPQDS